MPRTDRKPEAKPPLRLEWVDPATLDDNPHNWRRHPDGQLAALDDVIGEVGWAGALLYNERTKRLIDGHARKQVAKGPVPVLIGDWSEEDEKKILATLDPLGLLAETNHEAFAALAAEAQLASAALGHILDAQAGGNSGSTDADASPSVPGMDCTPYEHYDYVLIVSRTADEYAALCEKLGIKKVDATHPGAKSWKKVGLGRAIWGKQALERLK